jgi:hypothetical protein
MSVAANHEVNQAAEMADRFNRLFLRTSRQLRDLRRYNLPVLIKRCFDFALRSVQNVMVDQAMRYAGRRRFRIAVQRIRVSVSNYRWSSQTSATPLLHYCAHASQSKLKTNSPAPTVLVTGEK